MASRRLEDLAVPIRSKAIAFKARCLGRGVKVVIYQTLRSHAEQNAMYAIGRTVQKTSARITNAKAGESLHNPDANGKAWAFDAFPEINGQPAWSDMSAYRVMGEVAKGLGLRWGGDWKMRDYSHFEMDKIMAIDDETMARATESVKVETKKMDAAKSVAIKTAVVGAIALALPVLEVLFPQYVTVIKAVSGVLSIFGLGA